MTKISTRDGSSNSIMVIACGAIAKEIQQLKTINHWKQMKLQAIDADLHNYPKLIVPKIQQVIDKNRNLFRYYFIGYGDCGTGGDIDRLIERERAQGIVIERISGAHCYQFFMGGQKFEAFAEQEIGCFYLTDFLVKHFERIIIEGFKLLQYPELKSMLFNNYTSLVYVSQTKKHDEINQMQEQAKIYASDLGLNYQYIQGGYGDLAKDFSQYIKLYTEVD